MTPLKRYRKQNNLTQYALAKRLGIDRSAVSRWENGISKPDGETLVRVCRLTGLGMIELRPDLDFSKGEV